MEGGIDDTEPAAATNSAVFEEENRFGMCCEENIRNTTFGAFEEAQAMSERDKRAVFHVPPPVPPSPRSTWHLLPNPRPTIHLQRTMRPLQLQKMIPKFLRL